MSKEPEIRSVSLDSPILKLEQLHGKLIVVFDKLGIIRDTVITCTTATEALRGEGTHELAVVFRRHIMLGIDDQMRAVTTCIELLGGKTEYSAGMRSPSDPDYEKYVIDDDCDCCCHCDCDDDD